MVVKLDSEARKYGTSPSAFPPSLSQIISCHGIIKQLSLQCFSRLSRYPIKYSILAQLSRDYSVEACLGTEMKYVNTPDLDCKMRLVRIAIVVFSALFEFWHV